MNKKITCIECPKGCTLEVNIEGCRVVEVEGAECPKGEKYAVAEIENPVRILTSSVMAEGLALKLIPVRTSIPIPKEKMLEAMSVIKKVRVRYPVRIGEAIIKNFLGLNVDLIATRCSPRMRKKNSGGV